MKKDRIKLLIIRMLLDREANGYQIIKELSSKSVRARSNYVYRILSEMERDGSINGRWAPNKAGPKKHMYSLTEEGQKEFRDSVKDSLDLLMGAFTHFNLGIRDVSPVTRGSRMMLSSMGIPVRNSKDTKMVIATGGYDPMICYPYEFHAIAEILSQATIYVVKPPNSSMGESKRNLVVMDGLRHSMPFRDDFTDYLFLEGFPKHVPEERTVKECARVLKPEGCLVIRLVDELIEERVPKFPHFGSYVSKLFYDLNGQDKLVGLANVKDLLGRHFVSQNELQTAGDLFLYASMKKAQVPTEPRTEERISA